MEKFSVLAVPAAVTAIVLLLLYSFTDSVACAAAALVLVIIGFVLTLAVCFAPLLELLRKKREPTQYRKAVSPP